MTYPSRQALTQKMLGSLDQLSAVWVSPSEAGALSLLAGGCAETRVGITHFCRASEVCSLELQPHIASRSCGVRDGEGHVIGKGRGQLNK